MCRTILSNLLSTKLCYTVLYCMIIYSANRPINISRACTFFLIATSPQTQHILCILINYSSTASLSISLSLISCHSFHLSIYLSIYIYPLSPALSVTLCLLISRFLCVLHHISALISLSLSFCSRLSLSLSLSLTLTHSESS